MVWLYHKMCPKDADGMAISVDIDQQSHLGLDCLPKSVCPKTLGLLQNTHCFRLLSFHLHSDTRPTSIQEMDIGHEIISSAIFSLPLI